MRNLPHKWIQSGHFFQNQGTFLNFLKKGQVRRLRPPRRLSCCISHGYQTSRYDFVESGQYMIFTLFCVFFVCQLNATLNIDGPSFIA